MVVCCMIEILNVFLPHGGGNTHHQERDMVVGSGGGDAGVGHEDRRARAYRLYQRLYQQLYQWLVPDRDS